jgi:hypothetical protein
VKESLAGAVAAAAPAQPAAALNSSGNITKCVVPPRQGVLSFSTTCPATLHPFVGQRRARDVAAELLQLAVLVGREAEAHRTPAHFTTMVAWARIDGGTDNPIARAVERLSARSNWVGCCTGRSAGRIPLRIAST